MEQNPDKITGVGENTAEAIDRQARRDALLHVATDDLLFLAGHADAELIKAVRDLNTQSDSPDSYRRAHQLQELRLAVRHLLETLGFGQAIVPEPRSNIDQPRRRVRPPIVDVQLPE